MEFRNIAVLFDADNFDPDLIALASHLAQRHNAHLTGVMAAELPLIAMGIDGTAAVAAMYIEQRAVLESSYKEAGKAFSSEVPKGLSHRWVTAMQRPDMAILDVARSVDLIILGSTVEGKPGGGAIDVGSILLGAGRPVLVAAHGARKLEATKVVVAWKDTKEARRAIADALPFLVTAEEVLVAVVDEGDLAEERDSMEEIVAWLGTHGVTARGDVLPNRSGLSGAILQAAISEGADLIVSGAYGHSKFRQWLLGGMTKDILGAQGINRLLSN